MSIQVNLNVLISATCKRHGLDELGKDEFRGALYEKVCDAGVALVLPQNSRMCRIDPAVPVAGPPQTVSNLWNSTHHVFMHLHPGTTYQFFIRASTVKGFGPATAINVTTNISGMQMNTGQTELVCNSMS